MKNSISALALSMNSIVFFPSAVAHFEAWGELAQDYRHLDFMCEMGDAQIVKGDSGGKICNVCLEELLF